MATIELEPDKTDTRIWWLHWIERNEIIGKVEHRARSQFEILPLGPHWSPMKSFTGQLFNSSEAAADEVRLYFRDR